MENSTIEQDYSWHGEGFLDQLRIQHRWFYGPVYEDLPLSARESPLCLWTDDDAERERRLVSHYSDMLASTWSLDAYYTLSGAVHGSGDFLTEEISKLPGIGLKQARNIIVAWDHYSSNGILIGECFRQYPSEAVYGMLRGHYTKLVPESAAFADLKGLMLTKPAFRELKQWWLDGRTSKPIDVTEFKGKVHCPCCTNPTVMSS